MIEGLPLFVSILFILTTLLTVWFFFRSFRVEDSASGKAIAFFLPFWLISQGFLASAGFYRASPARLFMAVVPALLFVSSIIIFSKREFIRGLSLKNLTLLHVVRIPVEIVLYLLYLNRQIPEIMTFEGLNFDILAGISAPVFLWLAFRKGKINKKLLIGWNIAALFLLANIVFTAIFSLQTPFQQVSFEQPNQAVLFFPFIWLPSVVVPIVLFSHVASLIKLSRE